MGQHNQRWVGFRNREAACFPLLFLTISDNSKVIFALADVNGGSVLFLLEGNISESNKFHFENCYYACLEKVPSNPVGGRDFYLFPHHASHTSFLHSSITLRARCCQPGYGWRGRGGPSSSMPSCPHGTPPISSAAPARISAVTTCPAGRM